MLTLLTVAVAAAICSITIVHNADPATRDAELGSANALLRFDGSDPRQLEAGLVSARRGVRDDRCRCPSLGGRPGQRRGTGLPRAGSRGPYGDVLLALRRGSYPTGPGEVAVTDDVADLLRLEIGSTLDLDGRRRQVVGIVENPRKLSDEFALVSPSSTFAAEHVSVLVDTSTESLESFFGPDPDLRRPSPEPRSPETTIRRHPPWRCSPLPPSFCSWPRWSRPPASPSSPSDACGNSACSRLSAPRRNRFDSSSWRTAQSSGRCSNPRNDRGSRGLARFRAVTRVGARPSRGSARPALVADRGDRRSRRRRGHGGRVVAGAHGRQAPGHARSVGSPAVPRPARHSAIAASALIVAGVTALALSDRSGRS